jgi:hypothetical protein
MSRRVLRAVLDAARERASKRLILQLDSFEYNDKQFPSVDLQNFAQREHDRIQHLTVNVGCELIRLLRL